MLRNSEDINLRHVKKDVFSLCQTLYLCFVTATLLYLQCQRLLWRPSGWCLSGPQQTSWSRPWLLSRSVRAPQIHLSRQQQGRLFNTSCSSPTLPSRHVPVGLTQTKPTHRGLVRLASQLWQHPAKGQSPLSRLYISLNQTRRQEWAKKKRKTCLDDAEKSLI